MKSLISTFILLMSFFIPSNQDVFKAVFSQPQIVEINATLRFDQCNNKAYIPIDLPPNAKGWIYSVKPINKKERSFPKQELLHQIQQLSKSHSTNLIADYITQPRSKTPFNLYLLNGKNEVEQFVNCQSYKYIEKHIGIRGRSGYIKNDRAGVYYVGIEHIKDLKNLRLKVEAVAVL